MEPRFRGRSGALIGPNFIAASGYRSLDASVQLH